MGRRAPGIIRARGLGALPTGCGVGKCHGVQGSRASAKQAGGAASRAQGWGIRGTANRAQGSGVPAGYKAEAVPTTLGYHQGIGPRGAAKGV